MPLMKKNKIARVKSGRFMNIILMYNDNGNIDEFFSLSLSLCRNGKLREHSNIISFFFVHQTCI